MAVQIGQVDKVSGLIDFRAQYCESFQSVTTHHLRGFTFIIVIITVTLFNISSLSAGQFTLVGTIHPTRFQVPRRQSTQPDLNFTQQRFVALPPTVTGFRETCETLNLVGAARH